VLEPADAPDHTSTIPLVTLVLTKLGVDVKSSPHVLATRAPLKEQMAPVVLAIAPNAHCPNVTTSGNEASGAQTLAH